MIMVIVIMINDNHYIREMGSSFTLFARAMNQAPVQSMWFLLLICLPLISFVAYIITGVHFDTLILFIPQLPCEGL